MDLKSIFLQRLSYNADIASKNLTAKSGTTNSFDSFLSSASNTTKVEVNNSNKNMNTPKEKDVVKNDNSNINDSNSNKVSDDSKTDTKTTDKANTEVDKTEKPNETTKDKEKEIIKKISDELGVSVEQVQSVLQQLNITAQELAEPNNLLSFMQKLMNVDNPLDLLSIEGIKDMFENVKSIVEEVIKFQQNIDTNVDTNVDVELSSDIVLTENKTNEVVISEGGENQENNSIKQNNNTLNNTQTNTELNQSNVVLSQMGQESNQQQNMGSNQQQSNELLMGIQNNTQKEIFKAFTNAINKTEAGRNVDTADVIKQIVERLKTDFTSEVSEIKVTLKPEYLGDISLKVSSQNGIITAQFTAENQRIKEIIEANFEQLKDVLNEQGIQVSELSVNIGNEESNNAEQFNFSGEKSDSRIKNIIDDSFSNDDELELKTEDTYIDQGQVFSANVSYTA